MMYYSYKQELLRRLRSAETLEEVKEIIEEVISLLPEHEEGD